MSNKRILVAEDEEILRRGIALALEIEGYEVTKASNGLDALQAIMNSKSTGIPFNLLVCDINMPKLTGVDLIVNLKEIGATLPVVMISGNCEKKQLVRLMNVGSWDFINKPFEPDELCKKVAAMMNLANSESKTKGRNQ